MLKIDNEETLKTQLVKGINLFTGAGFSILPNEDGIRLPTGPEFAKEIIDKFELKIEENLDMAADIAPEEELQEFTRKRFVVDKINSKYNLINRLNLKSYITTNYDNIPQLIFSNNPLYKIYDVRGGPQNSNFMIPFIPIHGNVLNDAYDIIIGSLNVVMQNEHTSHSLKEAKEYVDMYPTLVWGYNLADSSAKQIFKSAFKEKKGLVWILCYENDINDSQLEYYHQMGCNLIIGDTDSMLNWIENNIISLESDEDALSKNKFLKQYAVPTKSTDVPSAETSDYFKSGVTRWFHILNGIAYERDVIDQIVESALIKNVAITGQKYSGKTTIIMQSAIKLPKKHRYYFDSITSDLTDVIISNIGNVESWIFIDNCPNLEIIQKLSKIDNIHVIFTANELLYESEKYFLRECEHEEYNVSELKSRLEARKIFEKIPPDFRYDRDFRYKDDEEEKYSMIELITKNVKGSLSKTMVSRILIDINNKDEEAIEALALAVYLSNRSSALTTDVIMAYFNTNKYDHIKEITDKVNSLLREISKGCVLELDEDQDYFRLRSGLFLVRALELFETSKSTGVLHKRYASVVSKFVQYVSPLRVWRYDDFKKREYDAELFYNLFDEDEANFLYETLYHYSENPYVLQQWALYHRRCGNYRRAYDEIVKVKSKRPNNPSVKNSYAMILFEMSDKEKTPESLERMKKAIKILEDLHDSDYRKKYHTAKYVDYAIILSKDYNTHDYLEHALKISLEIDDTTNEFKHKITDLKSLITKNNISIKIKPTP